MLDMNFFIADEEKMLEKMKVRNGNREANRVLLSKSYID